MSRTAAVADAFSDLEGKQTDIGARVGERCCGGARPVPVLEYDVDEVKSLRGIDVVLACLVDSRQLYITNGK